MATQPIDEEFEAATMQFEWLTPRLHKDDRFRIGYSQNEQGIYYPFVYFSDDPLKNGKPSRILIVYKQEFGFQLILGGMFVIVEGMAYKALPQLIQEYELDYMIVLTMKQARDSQEMMESQLHRVLDRVRSETIPL